MVTIIEIRDTFREMSQEHEAKQEEMFTKHEKLILDLISGHHNTISHLEFMPYIKLRLR